MKTLFKEEDDDAHYKPKRVSNFWNNNYIEYEINGNRIENLSLEEYLNKAKPYLRDIILDLQEFETCIIKLKIEINFISSKYAEEERVMHSKSDNINLRLTIMQMKLLMNSFTHFVQDINAIQKHQWKEVNLF